MMMQVESITSIVPLNLRLQYWSLYDYSNTYILVKGTNAVTEEAEEADAAAIQANERNKQKIFQSREVFTDFVTEINR